MLLNLEQLSLDVCLEGLAAVVQERLEIDVWIALLEPVEAEETLLRCVLVADAGKELRQLLTQCGPLFPCPRNGCRLL